MIELLQQMDCPPMPAHRLHFFLGVAFARHGQLSEALDHFGQVNHGSLPGPEDKAIFFTEYASVLYRADQAAEACALLRAAPVDCFSKEQRAWRTKFLQGLGHVGAPPLGAPRPPRILH